MDKRTDKPFLECERWWVFALLTAIGGFLGAFTYSIRGGVFSNAQTGNMVMMALAFGSGSFKKAFYYLLPMSTYFAGIIISEIFPLKLRRIGFVRWETVLAGVETLTLILLGFVPETAPYQISQIAITVICAMQFNTFRQAQGIPMATTFCTNNLRQAGLNLMFWIRGKRRDDLERSLFYFGMLAMFITGGIIGTVLCNLILGRAVWFAAALMLVIFVDFIYADLKTEREYLDRVPNGHTS